MSAILVSNLGKAYKQYSSKWARVAEWVAPFFGIRHQLKWVLKDISFTVRPGEALGIIGINGAGKSTLLKIITGTVMPTKGEVVVNGKVAALLELGMGFHPDFTGRQNVYMAGQLLGFSTSEISSLMSEIEAFAEIGEYIDQPVRVYSSGMQMRLAFSVATVRRPDVLIVDEALSVGDAYFQHKSFERIRQYRKLGSTLLIVSHDKAAIQSICDKAILLDGGRLRLEDEPSAIMDFYNAMLADKEAQSINSTNAGNGRLKIISGTGEATVTNIEMQDVSSKVVTNIKTGQIIRLCLDILISKPLESLVVGFALKDRMGQVIYGTNSYHLKNDLKETLSSNKFKIFFEMPMNLGHGTYSVSVALHAEATHVSKNYYWEDLALIFNIINEGQTDFVGSAWLPTRLTLG